MNAVIKRNLMLSKFSPQAGVSHTASMYMFNNNDIFVQVSANWNVGQANPSEAQDQEQSRGRVTWKSRRAGNSSAKQETARQERACSASKERWKLRFPQSFRATDYIRKWSRNFFHFQKVPEIRNSGTIFSSKPEISRSLIWIYGTSRNVVPKNLGFRRSGIFREKVPGKR